jgi:hypothetical protein
MKYIYILSVIDFETGRTSETIVADSEANALKYSQHWFTSKSETDVLQDTGKVIIGENRLQLITLHKELIINDAFINHYEMNNENDQTKMFV